MQNLDRKTLREEKIGSPRHRWAYNIKINLKEIGCTDVDRIFLTLVKERWQTVLNAVMNFWVHKLRKI
jgi:hypothetical protein